MLEMIQEMLSMPFIVRALIVGVLVALCASLLGVSLVLKRYSMIGDGLSHVGFGTLAIALALNMAPLQVSIPLVLLAAFLLLRLSESSKIKGDAAIALISSSSLAIGVLIISQTKGMTADICNYMFGSILAMKKNDVYLSIAVSVVVLVLYIIFYNKIYAVTFDEAFAKATGTNTGLYNMLIAFLTALVIVVGMRMIGAMLISSLIIFPALTSMRVFRSFRNVVISSAILSVICFFIGVFISYWQNTPTGASIVAVNLAAFLLFFAAGAIRKKSLKGDITTMKKSLLLLTILLCLAITGCAKPKTADGSSSSQIGSDRPESKKIGDIVDIKEKTFVGQCTDILNNPEDYQGKLIRLEGIFTAFKDDNGDDCCAVFRRSPGCCGDDGQTGFEMIYSGDMPKENDWIAVEGHIKMVEYDSGATFLELEVSKLTVKAERGEEFVIR